MSGALHLPCVLVCLSEPRQRMESEIRTLAAPEVDCVARACSAFLGWLHHERGVPVEELSLARGIPSAERGAVALPFDYIQWLTDQRGVSASTEALVIRSIMSAAKFLYHAQSEVS